MINSTGTLYRCITESRPRKQSDMQALFHQMYAIKIHMHDVSQLNRKRLTYAWDVGFRSNCML